MNRFIQTVRVVANPFFVLDHRGRPCGVVPVEIPVTSTTGAHLGFVGAKVDKDATKILRGRSAGDIRASRQDTVYAFSADPVTVKASPYYREAIRNGSLLPADTATSKWAGFKDFVEPSVALEQAKQKAEARFEADYGEGSLEFLRSRPVELPAEPVAPEADAAEPEPAPEKTPKTPKKAASDAPAKDGE